MMRFMNSSNSGTVNAVSPWFGLQIMPLAISELRVGASDVTSRSKPSAMSPGTVRAGTEFRHRAQVALLRRRQPIEAHAEEALVERRNGGRRRTLDVVERDRRCSRRVPRMLAPFLQEVGIAVRVLERIDSSPPA